MESLSATAVVLSEPGRLALRRLELEEPGAEDVVVDLRFSGISTGTERLLWTGRMPHFPGMGYPLVPGYEGAGTVRWAGSDSGLESGDWVFVPGARCYGDIRGLFGASASRVVASGSRLVPLPPSLEERSILLALAATAHRAARATGDPPELIVGHGALGRLLARTLVARGDPPPVVWEIDPERRVDEGRDGYRVCDPAEDERSDYRRVVDASGDPGIVDRLLPRLARGGCVVLAGFYSEPVGFEFPPAFLRELTVRVAAEWTPADLRAVAELAAVGDLSLAGLITHRRGADRAPEAYRTAFEDSSCVKMVLDWRDCA